MFQGDEGTKNITGYENTLQVSNNSRSFHSALSNYFSNAFIF